MIMHSYKMTAVLLAGLILGMAACGTDTHRRETIACSTSMLSAVAGQLAGADVDIVTIVPAGMCPGHFDVKPGDIAAVSRAGLLLYHGWEQWLPDLLRAVERPDLKKEKVALAGSWMVPDTHIRGVEMVRDIFIRSQPDKREAYLSAADAAIRSINEKTAEVRALLEPLSGVRVVCSNMQKDFLQWAGCDVVADYGRSEDWSPKMLEAVIRNAKEKQVQLVVDNLQSGGKAGLRVAEEIGAVHIVLTNFPVDDSYTAALESNIRALLKAIPAR